VTCSYNSCAERVNHCVFKVTTISRTAERTTAVSVSSVMAAHDASMVSRSAFSVDKLHPSGFPIGRSREVLGLETVAGTQ
jgi:hypothetical protein